MNHSLEEICRRILQQACDEGIVTFNREGYCTTESPVQMTSGDLCGLANTLRELLGGSRPGGATV